MPTTRSSQRKAVRNPFGGKKGGAIIPSSDASSSEEEDEVQQSSPPLSQVRVRVPRRMRSRKDRENDEDIKAKDDSDLEIVRRPKRSNTKRVLIEISSDEDEDSNADSDSILGSAGKKANAMEDIGEPETSGDEVMYSSPAKKSRRGSAHKAQTHRGPYTTKAEENEFVVDDEEEEDQLPWQSPAKSKLRKPEKQGKVNQKPSRRVHKDDILEEDGFVIDDEVDEDEDELPSTLRRRGKARQQSSEPESESEEDLPSPSKRRRLSQKKAKHRKTSRREEDDLAEDLDFLGGSSQKHKSSPSRLRSSAATPKVDKRKEALEEFKRRRAGENAESSSAPQPTQRRRRALYDTASEDGSEDQEVQDVEDDSEVEEVDGDDDEVDAGLMFNQDEDDEGFVVEDDENDTIGVPTDVVMPLAFSHLSRAKAKDLFKYAVEWMVQKKINPAFALKDEVYDLTFRKLDDEVKGLAGSKFVSAAWKANFTRSVKARPQIEVRETGADGIHDCEACGRSNHPATYQIRFDGIPYNPTTLDEVDNGESDSDDSSDSAAAEKEMYNHSGELIPPASTVYHVGQFCMRNAQTAHALEHWRFHLYEWVVEYLDNKGHLTPEKIVQRDAWKTKKRRRYANDVTDGMEESGEIRLLYQAFKNEVETAREAKGSGW